MPKKLATPDVISGTVTDEIITSFTIDIDGAVIYVVYNRVDSVGSPIISDASHSISGPEMTAAITRASQIAGADVYAAIKQALYEYLPGNGTIS